MANANLLDTKTVTVNEILGNGKIYKVPQFQRDYSWDSDQWDDLWNDIEIAEMTNNIHYMGSVVLQSSNGKDFSIIDGQQRFTTISILMLAVINAIQNLVESDIEKDSNVERVEILIRQYIGQKDPASLSYSSKLFLNENNDNFYQTRLLNFKSPINERRLSDSERLLWNAYQFFQNKVSIKFKNKSGGELAKFLNHVIGELMMFIQITVKDELNAYTVFETLNSRGVELTSTDLLKNFLFSLVAKSKTDLKNVKNQWKKIIDAVGLKEFPIFLRYYLVATRKQITKEYLFKEIKSFIKNAEDVFDLLDSLEFYAYNYIALGNSDDQLWNTDKELRININVLKAFRVTQWKPLALVAYEKLSNQDFKKLINAIVSISFRYNVVAKLQTNEMEKVYSKAAINLYKGNTQNLQMVINDLKSIYVNDEDFRNYFMTKQFRTANSTEQKLARYTLYKLESQENNGNSYDFTIDDGTIEHILPENPSEDWLEFFDEESIEKYIYSVGNLTLLEAKKNNREASNKIFSEKERIYHTSKFAITKNITFPEWNQETIKNRQAHLSKLATGIWKVQY
jgi:uncharacterized protein with ParB-like and HNH nuclease domain